MRSRTFAARRRRSTGASRDCRGAQVVGQYAAHRGVAPTADAGQRLGRQCVLDYDEAILREAVRRPLCEAGVRGVDEVTDEAGDAGLPIHRASEGHDGRVVVLVVAAPAQLSQRRHAHATASRHVASGTAECTGRRL